VSLEALKRIGLTPGSHAVVRGPSGYQSVRVQLVDRGNDQEIWLSQPVRDSIGAELFLCRRVPVYLGSRLRRGQTETCHSFGIRNVTSSARRVEASRARG
jgi:hypothetical protein